ncbi:unnamed protein product [Ilex paraguariensis]|uniref:Uncharacterized protein n=1 Tax=Ilex paraguariensis TaxID=185542 RepID=A0ABC8UPH0_9AQUA
MVGFYYISTIGFGGLVGDVSQRLCTAAEIKFYVTSLVEQKQDGSKTTNYLKPNKNCNLSSWVSGCEPGWACSVGKGKNVDLKNSKDMPARIIDCQPCCEGFFCPHGITCMIPCPLGSYCPLAKLNKTTGVCDPYHYQLPPGQSNHTCGGADVWADFLSGGDVFCSADITAELVLHLNKVSFFLVFEFVALGITDAPFVALFTRNQHMNHVTIEEVINDDADMSIAVWHRW